MAKKKHKDTVYVCGRPECNARIVLPDRGDAVKYPHRDLQGFKCDGLLVKYKLSPMGIREEIKARWEIFRRNKT